MEGDLGASQEAIRLLATDPGLSFIKAITDRHVLDVTDRQEKLGLWQTQISLLFRLITHPRVVESNVLEQEVNGIYTFLLGTNASRMDRLFSFVADVAGSWPDTSATDMPQMSVLESSLAVLSKLVDCCTNNVINDAFHHVVERFDGLVHASAQSQDDFSKLQAIKYLDYLQLRLGIGKNMAETKSTGKAHVEREAFVLSRDGPGHLSKDGPRHDNDHAEISQISIMPTYQEITSPRSEYLPTTDSSLWHIPGIRGRLDREFRLLREDTVGQLRDAVGDLLEHIRSPSGKDHRQSRNSVRTTTYEGAKIQQATLDKEKGLEFTVSQGPPGTGKSYTGEKIINVLLANKAKAKLGPIICVCYTNHALDQLLEHLLDDGINGIIRMGSRSKSERLQDLTLRSVAMSADLTRDERRQMWEVGQELKRIEDDASRLLAELSQCYSTPAIRRYLSEDHQEHYEELFNKDELEWQTVTHNRARNVVEKWLGGGDVDPRRAIRNLDVLKSTLLNNMTHTERSRLHRYWLKTIRDRLITEIVYIQREHNQVKEKRDRVRQEIRRRCLQQADIVGVTTTGLAREISLLRKLRSKVILCEEAGEVLEAHILTTLLPSVEQAILIGDHLQLRPQIQDYKLQSTNPRGQQYSLDMSLFERLVQPPHSSGLKLPVSVLETQRRMHPSIAEMVRSTLYNTLKDGENVMKYPPVVGMRHRLFWMHHEQLEAGAAAQDPNATSHSNPFEIEMTAALVSHIVRQGSYNPDDIAVLTPYLGQLQKLRARMAAESTFAVSLGERDIEELEELDDSESKTNDAALPKNTTIGKTTLLRSVRLATVDNFQGEEAKVVIISLVRSNSQNKCGFLSTSNRINVLMSRAKHGCYIIGNANTYSNVPMWNQIVQLLQDKGNFGPNVLSEEVDFLEMKEYREINVDETPCIFPDCGHFLTVESMDGQMNMGEHYELDERGMPVSIRSASKPFSMDEVKVCSKCRGSLRSISRYGRIVRRAMLDEATKKFISWCSNRHLELAERLLLGQQSLEQNPTKATEDVGRPGRLDLTGTAYDQIKKLRIWVGKGRYNKLLQTYAEILKYMDQVRVEEQPFHKVSDFVRHANRNHKTQARFIYDEDVIQLRGYLLAISLLLKCNIAILSDFLGLWKEANMQSTNINVDFSANLAQCEELIKLAADTGRPQLQVEGHTNYAHFCGFAFSLGEAKGQGAGIPDISTQTETGTETATAATATATQDNDAREDLKKKGLEHLDHARSLLESANWGSKPLMEADIEAAANMLNGSVFYKPVTTDELLAVYTAMASEFSGTGHWYTCERGHPFTVGECGMPMERARCPECGSPVGGQNHAPSAGVRRADDIEELARGVGGMEI
ncbi:hypothetical protein SLS53_002751 [Cytospora paraplurivora]|uniref:RZ-type domain-containing protein n=1 Tax=Cytospora paraplurivora TaxID=2898453 RepID=A0AAN9YKB2_9PEZI